MTSTKQVCLSKGNLHSVRINSPKFVQHCHAVCYTPCEVHGTVDLGPCDLILVHPAQVPS